MAWSAFDSLAEDYDKWYDENEEIYMKELECVKKVVKGKSLEVGGGTGRFCFSYLLDPSPNMLKVAKRRGCEAIRGVAEALPFRSSSFDTVYFVTSLCFVSDVGEALKEAKRVGKRVAACILVKGSELVKKYEEKGREGHPIFKHARFLSPEELGGVEVCKPFDFFECLLLS